MRCATTDSSPRGNRSRIQSMSALTAAWWSGAVIEREKLSVGFWPLTVKVDCGWPMDSILPERMRGRVGPASKRANLMLEEPPLMVRIKLLMTVFEPKETLHHCQFVAAQ